MSLDCNRSSNFSSPLQALRASGLQGSCSLPCCKFRFDLLDHISHLYPLAGLRQMHQRQPQANATDFGSFDCINAVQDQSKRLWAEGIGRIW